LIGLLLLGGFLQGSEAAAPMATPKLSVVLDLGKEADDLREAGHLARATEYRKRQLAAAQALGAHDCLVVAAAQLDLAALEHHLALMYVSQHQGELLSQSSQDRFAPSKALYFAAVDTLLRRKAAGTLMPGTCRAAEEAWFVRRRTDDVEREDDEPAATLAAPFVGYHLLMHAANNVPLMLQTADLRASTLTQEQLQKCMVLLAEAVDCFLRPRADSLALGMEGKFAKHMRDFVVSPGLILSYGGAGAAQLLERWLHVEQSGELQRRNVSTFWEESRLGVGALAAAVAAAAAAPGLRCCALASCGAREQHPAHFKSCGACKTVAYCCREHQVADWPSHKAACKAARKAAADADASRDSAR
jgi:hypothetical protein